MDVTVKTKVAWPHETILGGGNRQRINYDQLSLTQWVHGSRKNILDEPSVSHRDVMVSYRVTTRRMPWTLAGRGLRWLMPSYSARWSEER